MDIVMDHDLSIITELYYGFLLHFYKVLLLYAFKTFNFFFTFEVRYILQTTVESL